MYRRIICNRVFRLIESITLEMHGNSHEYFIHFLKIYISSQLEIKWHVLYFYRVKILTDVRKERYIFFLYLSVFDSLLPKYFVKQVRIDIGR